MICPKCHNENPVDSRFCKECAAPLTKSGGAEVSVTRTLETTPDELTRGFLFAGRYEIIEELGAGGMGKVYRAFDKKLQEEIALKLIRPEIGIDKRSVERFHNEIKVARKISHKNVCRVHDLGEEEKSLFISMEYVRGEDLKSFIRRAKQLSVGTAISIARQVAEGLGEAHCLGVVHRDLKPGNIMIDKEGNAKIMDFGIARTLAVEGITREGAMIGTPEYMSPEQVEGKEADPRADIYALGIILFEMVTGRVPFEGETPFSIANKHKTEPPPVPKKLVPQIPEGLNKLILRCLEKGREKRYQSAEELLADLGAVEAALPTAERLAPKRKTITPREITVKLTPRKLLIPAGAVILVAVIILGLWNFLPRKQAPVSTSGPPSVAILYFKNNTGDKNLDIWREGLSLSLITKLSQSRYIRVLDQSQIYGILKRLDLLGQDSLTPEDLKEIASRGLATHIVRGSLSKAGERFRIDLTLQNASTLQIIAPESADGTGEESLFAMVDSLSDRLKTNLGVTFQQAAADVSRSIRDVTTNSPEAYKLYVEGNRLANAGDFKQAISYFEKAVALDPQFAAAYMGLFDAYSYFGGAEKEYLLNIRKAFDLKERVSERERLAIEAEYYAATSEKTWDKAVDAYSKLITLYPWDLSATSSLAFLYWKMDEWDLAIEKYEGLRRYKEENYGRYLILAWCYVCKGQPDKAREVLEDYLATIADNALIRATLGDIYCIQGDFEKAKKETDKAYVQAPEANIYSKHFYLMCTEDFAALEPVIKQMEASPLVGSWIGFGSAPLALQGKLKDARTSCDNWLEEWQGKIDSRTLGAMSLDFALFLEKTDDFAGALAACETALRNAKETGDIWRECVALYCRGVMHARQGNIKDAQESAEELRRVVESGPAKKRIRFYEALLGVIALQKHDVQSAQDHLKKALSLTAIQEQAYSAAIGGLRSSFLDYLAEACSQAGEWPEAKKAYEDVLSCMMTRGDGPSSALVLARAYYKLGKVLEHLGDKANAAAKYRKFLDLWKNADPGLPEVEDAKKRLAALS